MISVTLEKLNKIKQVIKRLESKLSVKITYSRNKCEIRGEEFNEFLCEKIIKAIDFGFDVEDALLLLNDEFSLQFLNIKDYTKKKNLNSVRARIIGAEGRAKGTIEDLTGAVIVVNVNNIGIIVSSDHLSQVIQSIASLIHGAKHANVFAYLEKQNKLIRNFNDKDLGLKEDIAKNISDKL